MEDGTIKAAIERLEQERERLIAEKIEKGLAVRASPLVVGSPDEIDAARAREIAALREAGETREIVFGDGEIEVIITGVPRSARGQVQAHNVSYPTRKIRNADLKVKRFACAKMIRFGQPLPLQCQSQPRATRLPSQFKSGLLTSASQPA